MERVAVEAARRRAMAKRAPVDPASASSRELDESARAVAQPRLMVWHPGWLVLGASLALSLLGVYCISLTAGVSADGLGVRSFKQMVFMLIGLAIAGACLIPNYRRLPDIALIAAIGTLGLLVFVLLPFVPDALVTPRNGARRWINLGITDLQPSEVAKVVYVIVLAAYLRYRRNYRRFIGLVPPALIAFVPMVLILVEPDLGTALVFMPTLVAMLIAAGAKIWHLIVTGAMCAGFAGAIVAVSVVAANQPNPTYPLLKPHQVDRIQAVIDLSRGDTRFDQDRGFQGKQAMTLIGAGGVFGHSSEKSRALIHFSRVPEPHNDMIFAVVVNRFGLVGAIALISLYLIWIGGTLLVAARCREPFGRLIVVGFAAIIATQMIVNIGMTMGMLPITGMTLPFVSYGGSSLVMGFVMVGLIFNIGMRRAPYLWQRYFEYDGPDDEPD